MEVLAPASRAAAPLNGAAKGIITPLAFSLFFIFGSITSLNDVLMPKLKDLFQLNYGEMTMVQFCFFTSYFLVSMPAAVLIERIGYMRSVAAGLALMAVGCFLFFPAANSAQFPAFLAALFVVAAGITIVQVTANPLVIRLGRVETTPTRLTFAHACNSIGTVVAPYVGAMLILGGVANQIDSTHLSGDALAAFRASEAGMISRTYIGIALFLVVMVAIVWALRNGVEEERASDRSPLEAFNLLKRPRVLFGVIAMFLYIGAEVTIGSLLVNYLGQQSTMGLNAENAGKHLAFYWGGLLVGRLAGLVILRFAPAHRLVTLYGCVAFALVLLSMNLTGALAGWVMLAVGLCNSIMFPLIFALTSQGLGERTPEGSGLICVAIVGGAFVPVLTGYVADLTSLTSAFIIPALCYVGIVAFGWYARRPA